MSDYLDINNEELLKDFFSEADQQVLSLESNILVIESDPTNHEAIDEIFRAAHTLKGGSATVEMHELSGFTHVMEDLLDVIREGTVSITEQVVDVLLQGLDCIKAMLEARSEGSVYDGDTEPLKQRLKALIPEKKSKKKAAPKPSAQKTSEPSVSKPLYVEDSAQPVLSEYEILELQDAVIPGDTVFMVDVIFDEENPMNTVGGIQVFAALKSTGQVLKTIPDFDTLYEDEFHEKVLYFISSSENADTIEHAAMISEVTLQVEATEFSLTQKSAPSLTPVAPAAVALDKQDMQTQTQEVRLEIETVPIEEEIEEHDSEVHLEVHKKVHHSGQNHASGSVLRVDSRRIDYLLNLVSETVITKATFNQSSLEFAELLTDFQQTQNTWKERMRKLLEDIPDFLERVQAGEDIKDLKKELSGAYSDVFELFGPYESTMKGSVNKFRSAAQNLGRITGELQEGVMKIRMVPISQIFSRFPRLVRDLSRDLDKRVKLVIEGEDTELDKSVVEDLLDPMMHCVRNAIDHGVETTEERKTVGKPEEGIILLKASNEGNMIVIEIADDGHGIDVESVKKKAISRGIIHPGKNLTDVEAFQLIFEPGFSTASKITNVSGRGVGLDVVRTHIEKLNGTVQIDSQKGVGSRFVIRLPLTLAIIQGLLVRVGKEVYSIPITSVIESHRVTAEDVSKIDNYEVFNVRDEVISLLRLNRLFGIQNRETSAYNYIVIVGTSDKKIGLMVDSLIGEEDVVIKPLRDQFTNSPGIAGASILGDGSVSLIIDVSQLLDLGLKQEIHERERREASIW
ncbi:MAG TPA: chemotaxis protein CheA [Treponema sp.]|nr:chemotaxis protein CheA [Treponema sp.]